MVKPPDFIAAMTGSLTEEAARHMVTRTPQTEALGFRQMIAVIGDGSPESPSVRLHARVGFRHCGRLEGSGYKHGRWLDTVFMQFSMNGGSETPPDAEPGPVRA